MKATREEIMTALVAKLSAATFSAPVQELTTWSTVSRRLKLWTDVPAEQKPALFITEHDETPSYQSRNLQAKHSFSIQLYVYCDTAKDPEAIPSIALNVLLQAIETALTPEAAFGGRQTLGGLVESVRIEGTILKDPGDIDGNGLLMIPLKIFAT